MVSSVTNGRITTGAAGNKQIKKNDLYRICDYTHNLTIKTKLIFKVFFFFLKKIMVIEAEETW